MRRYSPVAGTAPDGCSSFCIQKFHPNLEFPVHRTVAARMVMAELFRNPEAHYEEDAICTQYRHDLAATQPEIVYDPYPGMVARECSSRST